MKNMLTKVQMLDKLVRVIKSCKNMLQLESAREYAKLWLSAYRKEFTRGLDVGDSHSEWLKLNQMIDQSIRAKEREIGYKV